VYGVKVNQVTQAAKVWKILMNLKEGEHMHQLKGSGTTEEKQRHI
jgi:hypothetical protein